ncbi:nucleotide disphospho-sugar-binding domain-containing protein [Nonomuraea sp. NPDC049028]|uniref:nucleotide disphospho-sugar-binding domain-containing protein n=1 Tax=Nonomuraea sp. NPDC049028 TaxID=3364348 RepID=UPI0037223DD2
MRVQFMTWGWKTHFFPLVPLAWAFRLAGHDVRVVSQPTLIPTITEAGLPAVPAGPALDQALLQRGYRYLVAEEGTRPLEWPDLRKHGIWTLAPYLRIAEAMLADSLDFTRAWRPDLIVYEATTYAGPMVAALLDIPAVRHGWGVDYSYLFHEFAHEALAPHRAALKLDAIDTLGVATVDPCPRSMQIGPTEHVDADVRRLWMRYIPYNGPGVVPAWLAEPPERRRICVTWGYVVGSFYRRSFRIGDVLRALKGVDAEIVAAVPPGAREEIGQVPEGMRVVEGVPLQLILPTCDLFVSQGGLGGMMTAMSCGIPQLVLPPVPDQVLNARQLARTGAGRFAFLEETGPDKLAGLVDDLLGTPAYGLAAGRLRAESAAQPTPDLVARTLTELAFAGSTR